MDVQVRDITDFDVCPDCHSTTYRQSREWYERCLFVRSVYVCNRCERRYWMLGSFHSWSVVAAVAVVIVVAAGLMGA